MNIDFKKSGGLVPAIIQEPQSGKVLMLGYMSEASLQRTRETGKVCFWSRSRNELWTKGETSGNFLQVKKILIDCDSDTLLIYADPVGPVCHTGTPTCFADDAGPDMSFLMYLQKLIDGRKGQSPESSYTARLFEKGTARIAQKVGEEGVECVIEAMKGDNEKLKEEAADLIYHLLVLLSHKELSLSEVVDVLRGRHLGGEVLSVKD